VLVLDPAQQVSAYQSVLLPPSGLNLLDHASHVFACFLHQQLPMWSRCLRLWRWVQHVSLCTRLWHPQKWTHLASALEDRWDTQLTA
jgi:hypothetical protein